MRLRLIFHIDQFDNKNKRRIGRNNATGTSCAVPKRRRNNEYCLVADMELTDALVPAFDNASGAEREFERLAAVT